MPERIPNGVAKRVAFRAIASSDHFTPATGKTIGITISKNGGAFASPAAGATNATEITSGFYYFDLGTGDTGTNGPLAWRGAGTGIDDVGDVYEVVNATNAGFTSLPDVASGSAGAVITSGTGTAQLSVSSGLVTLAGVTHTGAVIPTVTTTTTATNVTTVNGLAAGVITAAAIADNAIDAATFAADVDAEIAAMVWNAATATYGTAGTYGALLESGNVGGGAIVAASVTGNVGGNVTGSVGSVATGGITSGSFAAGAIDAAAIATNAIDADAIAADAVAEIVDGVWDEAIAGHLGAGSTGAALNGATAPTAAAVADAVWDEALAGHLGAGSTGEALNAAGSAGDPWVTALPGAYGAGSAGYIVGTNLNATVSSRLASSGYTAPLDAAGTRSAVGLASANLDTQLGAIDDYLDTEIAAIKAVTDKFGFTGASPYYVQADVVQWKGSAAPAMTGDAYARLGAPAGASIAADIATVDTVVDAIKVQTDNLPSGVKANTELANFEFLMLDSADHVTPKTGLTVSGTRSIDGGAFSAVANAISEVGVGIYKTTIAAADLNGSVITFRFTATGADARYVTIVTEP